MAHALDLTQMLLDCEERYRAFAQAAFDGVLIHRRGVIIEANDELARILGHARERLIGGSLPDFLSADARATVLHHFAEAAPEQRYELQGERPDGGRYLAEVRSREIAWSGGPAQVAVVREFTPPARAAEASETRPLLDTLQETYFRTDRAGCIVLASPSCRGLLHCRPEALTGLPLADLCLLPEDRRRFRLFLSGTGRRIRRYRTLLRRHDGRQIWVSTQARRYYDAQGNFAGVEGTVRDISHMIAGEERLQTALKAADAARRAKSEFLARMNHEIRTPMNGVLTMAQLLEGTALDAEQSGYLRAITSSARLLHRLLNDVLDLSRMEAGRLQLKSDEFEVGDMLRNLCMLVEPMVTGKGLSFRLRRVGLDRPVMVIGDAVRLQQVLLNLLSNAVKFTDEGFVELNVEARPSALGWMLSFAVSDSGSGIREADRQRLLQTFEQGDGSSTRRFGGAGLGLAIASGLVKAMDGRITIDGGERRGTTVEVVIALRPGSGARAGDDAAPASDEPRYEFLLVDDDAINRTAMSALLRRDGHEVTLANDGFQALEILAQRRFDYVLMDVHMPGIDGIETVRRYRMAGGEQAANAQIIALTADTRGETILRCDEVGIRHTLAKPLIKRDLYRAIDARRGARSASAGAVSAGR